MSSLAAVQADGYYHPPDYDPQKHGSLNKFRGSHGALGARASKLHEGILVVRFEMPFPVWCGNCNHLMARGVRFNAEKRQIGEYHSTKVWAFSMRTPCCKNKLEIHTDPRNAEYVIATGGRRRVEHGGEGEDGGRVAVDPQASDRPTDALGRLEKSEQDRKAATERRAEIAALREQSEMRWGDDVQGNRELRREMRSARRDEQARDRRRAELGLPEEVTLAPETQSDRYKAASVSFGAGAQKHKHNWRHERRRIANSSIFSPAAVAAASGKRAAPSSSKAQPKPALQVKARRLDSGVKLKLSDPSTTKKKTYS